MSSVSSLSSLSLLSYESAQSTFALSNSQFVWGAYVYQDLIKGGEDGAAICINKGKPGGAENEEQCPAGPGPQFLQQGSSHSQGGSEG